MFKRKGDSEKEIVTLANSNNWRDRVKAIEMISKNPTEHNLILLIGLLGDSDWSVAKNAEELFMRIGDMSKEILLKYGISNSKESLRKKAYNLLIKMGYKYEAISTLAEYYESSGNYEKAANLYEKIGDIENAEELRKRAKETYVYQKSININVNLDSLFEYIRTHGLVVKYRCPSCGATLEIDGKNTVYYCPYCGTKIEIIKLQKLLESVLK